MPQRRAPAVQPLFRRHAADVVIEHELGACHDRRRAHTRGPRERLVDRYEKRATVVLCRRNVDVLFGEKKTDSKTGVELLQEEHSVAETMLGERSHWKKGKKDPKKSLNICMKVCIELFEISAKNL